MLGKLNDRSREMRGGLTSAGIVFGVLGGAGAMHARRLESLVSTLGAHRLLTRPLVRPVAGFVALTEISLGILGLAGLAFVGGQLLAVAALLSAALYASYTVYLIVLVRIRPGSNCGCNQSDLPANWAHVLRSAVLCVLAVAAARSIIPISNTGLETSELILTLCVIAGGVALVWISPEVVGLRKTIRQRQGVLR